MSLREELQRKQQRWMAERERELDRHEAQEVLGLGSKVDDHRLLDRVTSQIAERMQVEMRLQNARAMQDGAVGDRVERLLERHLEAHTCGHHGQRSRRPGSGRAGHLWLEALCALEQSWGRVSPQCSLGASPRRPPACAFRCGICLELMSGKERRPTLLFPCGHTFCAACLRRLLEQSDKRVCPHCRQQISSQAPNVSLQQVCACGTALGPAAAFTPAALRVRSSTHTSSGSTAWRRGRSCPRYSRSRVQRRRRAATPCARAAAAAAAAAAAGVAAEAEAAADAMRAPMRRGSVRCTEA